MCKKEQNTRGRAGYKKRGIRVDGEVEDELLKLHGSHCLIFQVGNCIAK